VVAGGTDAVVFWIVPVPQKLPGDPFDWAILGVGLVVGLALSLAAGAYFLSRRSGPDNAVPPAGVSWSLADSWASNLTAIVTALAAAIALFTDDLAGVLGAHAPVVFAVTAGIFLVFASLAPVVYTVAQSTKPTPGLRAAGEVAQGEVHGTRLGWCLSAMVTLFAVEGAIGAAGRLVFDVHGIHGWVTTIFLLVIAGIGALVFAYVIRSFVYLDEVLVAKDSSRLSELSGMVTVSCCSGREGETRLRMTIL
jgi:hypothetical protein